MVMYREMRWMAQSMGILEKGLFGKLLFVQRGLGTRARDLLKNGNEVVQSKEVSVLVVAQRPAAPMVNVHTLRQFERLRKVNHKDAHLFGRVNDEKAAADDFVLCKEGRVLEALSQLPQSADDGLAGFRFALKEGGQCARHLVALLYQVQVLVVFHI